MYGKKATMSSEEVLDIMQRHSTPEDTIVSYGFIDYGILYDVLKVWVWRYMWKCHGDAMDCTVLDFYLVCENAAFSIFWPKVKERV